MSMLNGGAPSRGAIHPELESWAALVRFLPQAGFSGPLLKDKQRGLLSP